MGLDARRAWLSISSLAEIVARDPTCLTRWLGDREHERYRGFTVPKRRREWLAGRIVAKELVRRRHDLADDLRAIEIVAADSGKPSYRLAGEHGPYDLSITHSGDHAVAALATARGERIGIDIEQIEERERNFEPLALSAPERAMIAPLRGNARAVAITERWVLKEALAKALGAGMRLRFHDITVELDDHIRFLSPHVDTPGIRAQIARVGSMCVGFVALPSAT